MADLRVHEGVQRGRPVTIRFDGDAISAFEGETIAAALWAAERLRFRSSVRDAAPRGLYCNMGVCFDCLVRVAGRSVRACMTPVSDGMEVESA